MDEHMLGCSHSIYRGTRAESIHDTYARCEVAAVSRFVDVAIVSGKRATTYECDGKPA